MQYFDSVKLYKMLAVSMFFTVVFFVYAVYLDFTPEWKKYQRDFIKLQVSQLEEDLKLAQETAKKNPQEMKQEIDDILNKIKVARSTPIRIGQIIVSELKKVDRCITCHMGILDPNFKDEKIPLVYRTHPRLDEILGERHPVEKYGCTICHEGQGYATSVNAAHEFAHHWEYPMLVGEYMQISCGKCHNAQKEIPGAPWIQKGKDTVKAKGACLACHKIHEDGPQKDAPCPELSWEGSKREYEYDYFNVDDKHGIHHNAILSWQYEHFKNPSGVSPGTQMPNLGLNDEEIKALTIYVLSQRDAEKDKMPVQYLKAWNIDVESAKP